MRGLKPQRGKTSSLKDFLISSQSFQLHLKPSSIMEMTTQMIFWGQTSLSKVKSELSCLTLQKKLEWQHNDSAILLLLNWYSSCLWFYGKCYPLPKQYIHTYIYIYILTIIIFLQWLFLSSCWIESAAQHGNISNQGNIKMSFELLLK